jgi:glycosyltransferase involved in cell wall biosynthesis
MFEYMASGRVIVSSDLPVIREILTDGQEAYLVEPDNVEAWYAAIQAIAAHPEEAGKMAYHAKEKVLKYTWKNRAATIEGLL